MSKDAFSASRITTYKTCPRLYHYQYIERIEEPKHVLTIMGSALHKAIEMHYKNGANVQAIFSKEFYNGVSFAESKLGIRGKESPVQVALIGEAILKGVDWSLKPLEIEKSFSLPFPSKENPVCIMRGIIDMVVDGGIIIDHKSTKTKPTKKKLAENYQFAIYAWAYRELYGELPDKVYWHHLRTGELIDADVLTNLDRTIELIASDILTIISDKEFKKIEQNGFCKNVCNFYDRCWGGGSNVETSG